jgi:hypothetical protein
MKRGKLVKVLPHKLPGRQWTIHSIGSIVCAAHIKDFDVVHMHNRRDSDIPPLWPGWWIVSVSTAKARGGYAFALLPEEHLAPHACTERCPKHLCQMGTG